MSASDAFETAMLTLLFNNSNIANYGDATGIRGSSTAGSLFIALHTADPGEAGSQTTSEATYTSYARVAVARASGAGGFTISGTAPTQAVNVSTVNFPACTGGSNTITHFSIGRDTSGAGQILVSGILTASLSVSTGITPSFAASALVCTLD